MAGLHLKLYCLQNVKLIRIPDQLLWEGLLDLSNTTCEIVGCCYTLLCSLFCDSFCRSNVAQNLLSCAAMSLSHTHSWPFALYSSSCCCCCYLPVCLCAVSACTGMLCLLTGSERRVWSSGTETVLGLKGCVTEKPTLFVPQPFRPCQGDVLQGRVVYLQNAMWAICSVILKVIKWVGQSWSAE